MNTTKTDEDSDKQSIDKDIKLDRLAKGLFFTFTAAFGLISGFGVSLVRTKKKQTEELFPKKDGKTQLDFQAQRQKQIAESELHEAGIVLARRALVRATCYSVGGVGLFCFCIWKLSGASNFEEFRLKIGNTLPRIKRKEEQVQGRTEFANLTDLFQYIIDEDKLEKKRKSQKTDDNNGGK